MGVPGLFSFLRRRYPLIVNPVTWEKGAVTPAATDDHTDNLYIDMNHIIHSCTHAHVAKDRSEISQAQMFAGIERYLNDLLDIVEPRHVVVIAIDGVAPRAKLHQQRTRRYLAAHISDVTDSIERAVRREMMSEAGGRIHIPALKRFDPNIITPGTEFMLQLADFLRDWAAAKVAGDARFAGTVFVISDAAEPGEGEHKIMRFIRHLKSQPCYDSHTRHVIFGQDADLLLLTLMVHEPNFKIIREDMQAAPTNSKSTTEVLTPQQCYLQQPPKQQQQQSVTLSLPSALQINSQAAAAAAATDYLNMPAFEIVDINLLRQCLHWEFSSMVGEPSYEDHDPDSAAGSSGNAGVGAFSQVRTPAAAAVDNATVGAFSKDRTAASAADVRNAVVSAFSVNHTPAAAAAGNAVASACGKDPTTPTPVAAAAAAAASLKAIESGGQVDDQTTADHTDHDHTDHHDHHHQQQHLKNQQLCDPTDHDQQQQQQPDLKNLQDGELDDHQRDLNQGDSDDHDDHRSSTSLDNLLDLTLGESSSTAAATPPAAAAASSQTVASSAEPQVGLDPASQVTHQPPTAAAAAEELDHLSAKMSAATPSPPPAAAPLLPPSVAVATPTSAADTTAAAAAAACTAAGSSTRITGQHVPPALSTSNSTPVDSSSIAPYANSLDSSNNASSVPTISNAANPPASHIAAVSNAKLSQQQQQHSKQQQQSSSKHALNFENLLDDLTLLTFLVGNDFLPNIPSLEIYDKPSGLDLLFAAYKHLLPDLGGHITSHGVINVSRLVQVLVFLTRDEEAAYKRRADYRRRRSLRRLEDEAAADAELNMLLEGGLSLGEVAEGADVDQILAGIDPSVAEALGIRSSGQGAVNLNSMTQAQLVEELSTRVSARVKDRIMGGDPWAQDPLRMEAIGYRQRYYKSRFPDLYQDLDGDIDKIADRVSREYLAGMQWVLRYYTVGPAAIDWQQQQQQQQQQSDSVQCKGEESVMQAAAAAAAEGCSWSWCYPYYYAPLIQDLAKIKLPKKNKSSKDFINQMTNNVVTSSPIPLARSLHNPSSCALQQWAPEGGPVRPLLQLMCVLPAKSASEALPPALASLLMLAENMQPLHTAAARTAASSGSSRSRPPPAAAAARSKPYRPGLELLADLDSDNDDDDDQDNAQCNTTCTSQNADQNADQATAAAAAAGDALSLLGVSLSGDVDADMLQIAQQLAAAFPADVEHLVDLTGKKWLHSGVVKLPQVQPEILAAAIQLLLRSQQQHQQRREGDSAAAAAGSSILSEMELLNKSFGPAAVICSTAAAAAAAVVKNKHNTPSSSNSDDSSSSGSSDVWRLLTAQSTSKPSQNTAAASNEQDPAATSSSSITFGALGMMLSQRAAMHLGAAPNALQQKAPQQKQQKLQSGVWRGTLDVAGLSAAQHQCCLSSGINVPQLIVTAGMWRRIAANFSATVSYADRVLGIKSSSSSTIGWNNGANSSSSSGRVPYASGPYARGDGGVSWVGGPVRGRGGYRGGWGR